MFERMDPFSTHPLVRCAEPRVCKLSPRADGFDKFTKALICLHFNFFFNVFFLLVIVIYMIFLANQCSQCWFLHVFFTMSTLFNFSLFFFSYVFICSGELSG